MAKKSYAKSISDAQVMVSGLRANLTAVERRGIDAQFVDTLEQTRAEVTMMNDEQERLKAQLKMKTAELNQKLKEMNKMVTEGTKIVKLDFPKEQWKEFGVTVTR